MGSLKKLTIMLIISMKMTENFTQGLPAPKDSIIFSDEIELKTNSVTPTKLLDYLKKFGYLEEGEPNSEALFTEEAVKDAVRNLQSFGGLAPTGNIDSATLELLGRSRCGNKDQYIANTGQRRRKRFIIGAKGWRKRRITYHLSNWTPKLRSADFVKKELRRAFESWAPYAGLNFVEIDDYYKADVRIVFGRYSHGDYYPFDGPGVVLAHAYYPYEFGDFGGDIHFDEDEDWSPDATPTRGMDFFTVAVHEIGHSLGLSHSPVQDSIMYPFYKGPEKSFALGYDDILGMYQQYITKPFEEDDEETTGQDDSDEDDASDYPADEGGDYDRGDDNDRKSSTTTTTTTTTTATTTTTTTTFTSTRSTTTSRTTETVTQTYNGDYEDVDDHIRRNRPTSTTVSPGTNRPASTATMDPCDEYTNFDAFSRIRDELFLFKGSQMWRYSSRGRLRPEYPAPFKQMFGFPDDIERIDAVLEKPDGKLIFFSGNQFWNNDGSFYLDGPYPLTDLGLPGSVPRVDAAFLWGKNKKVYVFHANQYWRFSDKMKLEEGYPKDISNWRGVPGDLNAAFTWTDGVTYFFKSGYFWRFNDANVITESVAPQEVTRYWLGC